MKKIWVRVSPNKKQCRVTKMDCLPGINQPGYKVDLTALAKDNQANLQLIEVLAAHFKLNENQIFISQGATQRNKLITLTN
ncbi:MAG: DUF167 domain-containing protein [Patescibacteria group bacterium]|nr:DUF167 domain-containing protein [Patescibacteria group bacterium]